MNVPLQPESGARRGRGRPRAFDREIALGVATSLFWAKGFEATSIADLTTAMGIQGPSLYAAFGSKEALYAEALGYYQDLNERRVWSGFHAASTARGAIQSFLTDSAVAFSIDEDDIPRGCMIASSTVGCAGQIELGELARSARAATFERLRTRFQQAVEEQEMPAQTDISDLARYVQAVQHGMAILARDAVSRAELEGVADIAMLGWSARARSE